MVRFTHRPSPIVDELPRVSPFARVEKTLLRVIIVAPGVDGVEIERTPTPGR
jgi:hypothetical protein